MNPFSCQYYLLSYPLRFRTYFPDAYKQHYPNAKTHLSSKVRSTLPDGTSLFAKTRSKKRRPFTEEEDRALKMGYEKHGTVWATIVKDPIFQDQKRRSTDLRDRFRNAFPDLYQAAGYKPRNSAAKKKGGTSSAGGTGGRVPVRAATDDQLAMSSHSMRSPLRRRRAQSSQGLLRGGTKSVPESTTNSDDEESSGGEEDGIQPLTSTMTPAFAGLDMDNMDTIDPHSDPLSIPDFLPNTSHSHTPSQSELESSQTWSSGLDTPVHWSSTTAGSPTSSHLSSEYIMHHSPYRRGNDGTGMGMIGKSAWGTQDWFSANPRLDSTSTNSSSSYLSPSSTSSSPFSFHNLNHNNHTILDRYDLFPTSFPHDFSSEVGMGDSHSTAFSDPEIGDMFPSSGFRGFTHHSNYAGDLIFGARTHQPVGYGGFGLGLSGSVGNEQTTGIHPMQLHTPALPGINEVELGNIDLNDRPRAATTAKDDDDPDEIPDLDLNCFGSNLEDIVNTTPPGTPIMQPRPTSSLGQFTGNGNGHGHGHHGRSVSVPPTEHRIAAPARPGQLHANSHPLTTGTKSLPFFVPSNHHQHAQLLQRQVHPNQPEAVQHDEPSMMHLMSSHPLSSSESSLYDLPFLDLHYNMGPMEATTLKSDPNNSRQGQALDLAQSAASSMKSHGIHPPPHSSPSLNRFHSYHHRGHSAVSQHGPPSGKVNDNKRKRSSWDGGAF
jgi:hypothetical protein